MIGHENFGRLRLHRHTSYAALVFLVLLAGVVLLGLGLVAQAANPPNPQSGSVGLSGTVRGNPPTTAAVILAPANGSHTSKIPITVSGTCPAGTFVDIEKNNVFAGAAACQDNGTFSVAVDLFVGSNTLVARVADALGQFGPDSAPVVVYYDAPVVSTAGGNASKQLFLTTTQFILGGSPGTEFVRSVSIVGGVAPYAVSWDYGDNDSSLSSTSIAGAISSSHAYARPGIYNVIVRVTDATGNSAYMQVLAVVNGPVAAFGTNGGFGFISGELIGVWPLLVLAAVMVLVFWLGEKREVHKLRRQQRVLV